jgi:hypothetical protein
MRVNEETLPSDPSRWTVDFDTPPDSKVGMTLSQLLSAITDA